MGGPGALPRNMPGDKPDCSNIGKDVSPMATTPVLPEVELQRRAPVSKIIEILAGTTVIADRQQLVNEE